MVDLMSLAAQSAPIDIVSIGCSTGGPEALGKVIPLIPSSFHLPIVIVQHMMDGFCEPLAESLDLRSEIKVKVAEEGEHIKPATAYIAPSGIHMVVKRKRPKNVIAFDDSPPECSCKPAVDVLFRSVADLYGKKVLAVMLTGMGQDGLVGSRAIKEAGGTVLAQDEETSVIWAMPGAVVKNELTYKVLPIDKIAEEITMRARRGGVAQRKLDGEKAK